MAQVFRALLGYRCRAAKLYSRQIYVRLATKLRGCQFDIAQHVISRKEILGGASRHEALVSARGLNLVDFAVGLAVSQQKGAVRGSVRSFSLWYLDHVVGPVDILRRAVIGLFSARQEAISGLIKLLPSLCSPRKHLFDMLYLLLLSDKDLRAAIKLRFRRIVLLMSFRGWSEGFLLGQFLVVLGNQSLEHGLVASFLCCLRLGF